MDAIAVPPSTDPAGEVATPTRLDLQTDGVRLYCITTRHTVWMRCADRTVWDVHSQRRTARNGWTGWLITRRPS